MTCKDEKAFKAYIEATVPDNLNYIVSYQVVNGTAYQRVAYRAISLISAGRKSVVIHANINHPNSHQLEELASNLTDLTNVPVKVHFHRLRRNKWVRYHQ